MKIELASELKMPLDAVTQTFAFQRPALAAHRSPTAAPVLPGADVGAGVTTVSAPQARMLNALASFECIGQTSLSRSNLAVFSDQSPKSSGFERNLSVLRSKGMIDYPSSAQVTLTASGRAFATPDAEPATLHGLHAAWFAKISGPQQRMLEALIEVYPNDRSRVGLAEASGQSPISSGYERNLSVLRSLGVIHYPDRGQVVATSLLFPEELS